MKLIMLNNQHKTKQRMPAKWWAGMSGLLAFLLILMSPSVSHAQLSGTYTICNGSCDYQTMTDAANDLNNNGISSSVTFKVAAENFNENPVFYSISGASSSSTITFTGAGKGKTRIYSYGGAVLELDNTTYITFQDMTIEQTSDDYYTYGIYLGYTQNVTFRNCKIVNPILTDYKYENVCVHDDYSTYTVFQNNYFTGGFSAFTNYGDVGYGNNLYKNNIMTQSYYYIMDNENVDLNVYDGNYMDSMNTANSGGYAINTYFENEATYKNNNFGPENMSYGIMGGYPNYYANTTPFEIVNNFFGPYTGITYNGITMYSYFTSNVNFKIVHNTIDMAAGDQNIYWYTYSSPGWELTNNLLTNKGTSPLVYLGTVTNGYDVVDGNDYYNAGGILLYYNNISYSDLAVYKSVAIKDGNGAYDQIAVATYKTKKDLHLDQTQPAPYSKSVGVTLDIDGDTRCAAFPTVGADESFFGKGKSNAKITGPANPFAGSPTTYFNSAKQGEPKIYKWYMDAINTSSKLSDSIHLLTTAITAGKHTLYLVTTSCTGNDTAKLTITAINATKKPSVDFISDINLIRQGGIVKFTDLSTNGPNKWTWKISPDSILYGGSKVATVKYLFGTNASTYNLVAQFNYGGKYKVCLTTANAAGVGTTNCKVAYIEVTPSINIGSVATITDPKGNLYDDGGPFGNYSYTGKSFRKAVIDPCADSVYLVLNYFNTWCGYDFLRIYEGKDNTGKVLHLPCTTTVGYNTGFTGGPVSAFCNGSLPGCLPNTIQNYTTGGTIDTFKAKTTMYLEFEGEYAYNAQGFEAFWWSKPRTEPKPKASFTSVDSICTNGVVNFTNTSSGSHLTYLWDLDGDPSYYEYDGKNTSWPYFYPAKMNITLIATNCGGSDTFMKQITVYDPKSPKANFSADNTNPTVNDVVFLSTKSIKECVDAYTWKITKKYPYTTGTTPTVVYMNGTSASSPNPAINLPDTGCWDVSLNVSNVAGSDIKFSSCFINVKGAYCTPTVSTTVPDIGISKVTFNTIGNSSTQGITEYQNFTPSASTTVEIGMKYKLSVERATNKNYVTRTVYFDWNGDGDFNDASEFYADDTNSTALVWNTDVTIPLFATKGATVMRIAINQGNYGNKPCGQNEFGEYEDYRIYITDDQTPPVIKIKTKSGKLVDKDTVYVEQGYHYGDLGAQALDNLDGDITDSVKTTHSPAFNNLIPGTYKFIYNVMDAHKNVAQSKTRVVIVTPDKSAPTLYVSLPETTIVQVGNPVRIPVVIAAEDSVDGDVSGTVLINNPVLPSVIGTYTITYSDSDSYGNKVSVKRYVIIIDTIPPTISLKGKDTVYMQVGTSYTDAGVNYLDNYNNVSDLGKKLVVTNTLVAAKLGTYDYSYIVQDESGNKSPIIHRTVIVFDSIKPVVTINGNVKEDWDVNVKYKDLDADATDNYYPKSSLVRNVSGTFYAAFPNGIPTTLGTYTIIYSATDGSLNKDSAKRTINVVDRIAPVITLKGEPSITICRWTLYTDAGYTLTDNYWLPKDITVTKEGSFTTANTLLAGLYSLRYKAVDKSGNVGYSDYRFILVEEAGTVNCISSIQDPKDLAKQISVFPNPNTGKFIIKTSINTNEKVRISVSNVYGQEIAVVNNGILNNNQFEVDLSTQAAGMYTVSIMMNNTVVTKQVMVTR